MKSATKLAADDFRKYPIWEFTGDDDPDECMVRPVRKLPVSSTSGTLIACEVSFANGEKRMAFLGNLKTSHPQLVEHFLTISVFREDGELFHLARYHDIGRDREGPDALAVFLKRKKEEVFPISWDVSTLVDARRESLSGTIETEPKERLSRRQIISLAISTQ